jgi:predicted SprT family Zn-dependent metalloprotease
METLECVKQNQLLWSSDNIYTKEQVYALLSKLMRKTWDVNGREINLTECGWSYKFNNRKVSLGVCKWGYKGKSVEISLPWIEANPTLTWEMEDVIRHEIAHAIDYEIRRTSYHDTAWKRICVQIGADPSRLYDNPDANKPKGKYTLKCPKCGIETPKHRKPKRSASCGPCGNGSFNPALRLELIQNW